MCNKRSYSTRREAGEHLSWIKTTASGRHKKIPKRSYRCPDCGELHLTSSSRPNSNKHTVHKQEMRNK